MQDRCLLPALGDDGSNPMRRKRDLSNHDRIEKKKITEANKESIVVIASGTHALISSEWLSRVDSQSLNSPSPSTGQSLLKLILKPDLSFIRSFVLSFPPFQASCLTGRSFPFLSLSLSSCFCPFVNDQLQSIALTGTTLVVINAAVGKSKTEHGHDRIHIIATEDERERERERISATRKGERVPARFRSVWRKHLPNPGIAVIAVGRHSHRSRNQACGGVLPVEDDCIDGAIVVVESFPDVCL